MPVRPPQILAPKSDLPDDPISETIEHEVLAEKAATYGRLLKRLEIALGKLQEADTDSPEHSARHAAAAEALWFVVIQRDLCGFRKHEVFFKELNIPRSLVVAMGPRRVRS